MLPARGFEKTSRRAVPSEGTIRRVQKHLTRSLRSGGGGFLRVHLVAKCRNPVIQRLLSSFHAQRQARKNFRSSDAGTSRNSLNVAFAVVYQRQYFESAKSLGQIVIRQVTLLLQLVKRGCDVLYLLGNCVIP